MKLEKPDLLFSSPISEKEFQQLYFDNYEKVVKIGMYLVKDSAAAEDIAQSVFIKLWEKRDQLHAIQNIGSYIAQITRNDALDFLKPIKTLGEESIPLNLTFEEKVNQDEAIKSSIEKALGELAPQCRLVFSLSRLEGLTNDEIAEYLSISIRTVETQISNALKRFRTDLRKYFIEFLGLGLLMIDFL